MTTQVAAIHSYQPLPSGCLPAQVSALYVAGAARTDSWIEEAFAADSACQISLESATSMSECLTRLRNETFDVVLVSHELPSIDGPELVEAIRAGSGEDQAVVVMGSESDQEMAAVCFEAGADAYVLVDTSTTRALLWTLARALDYRRVMADNRRMQRAELHRRDREHDEADRVLEEQRRLVEQSDGPSHEPVGQLPERLVEHYRELLRTYVIMGTGSLAEELEQFVSLLLTAGISSREAMLLHVHVLAEMIEGLGNRSARHVMNRGDLLIMELMVHLTDGYRQRFFDYLNPPRQKLLPGFDDTVC